MAQVAFKKGLLADLPAAIAEGTFYVTTDERALYLDVNADTRVRIGDFQEFATLTALQAHTNPSTTALYYVADINCLAKWDGEKYIQINLDTGATSIEVVGTGNAITKASYNPATRKLTLTADATYTTAEDVEKQIDAKVGELKLGEETFDTVKEYVDKKTDGIATDAALETLTNRVTAAEGKIDKLNGDKATEGSVAKTVDDAIKDLDLGNTYEAKGANDDAIAAAKKAGDDAQTDVDALKDKVGAVPEDKTVVQLIEDAKDAATYDDTELAGKINTLIGTDTGKSARTIANEELAKQLIPENAKESLDTLAELAAWIQAHPDDVSAINKAIADLTALVGTLPEDATSTDVVAYIKEYVDGAIAALKIGDYAKAADLTALAARVTALEEDTHTHDNKDVLDGITAEKVDAWDGAEQNAKDYTDTALTWGTF